LRCAEAGDAGAGGSGGDVALVLVAETYLRLALKAQSQSRASIESLAQIKNPPVVYARQANFANGPQRVNSGVAAPRRGKTKSRGTNNQDTSMSYYRTAEHRRLRAELIQRWKPWEQSTGPRTAEGKATSARNGCRGGERQSLRALAKRLDSLEVDHLSRATQRTSQNIDEGELSVAIE
jgi:hypothetical protein